MTTDFTLLVTDRSGIKSFGSYPTLAQATAAIENAEKFGNRFARIEERAEWGTRLVRVIAA